MKRQRQCELVRGASHRIGWIDTRLAVVGTVLDNGWKVATVWHTTRTMTEDGWMYEP